MVIDMTAQQGWDVSLTRFGLQCPPPASLRIVKQVLGGSSSSPFTVTVAGPSGYNVITTVTTSAARVISPLVPGIYTITEDSLSGWSLTNLSVLGDIANNSTIDVLNRRSVIDLASNDNIQVILGNTQNSPASFVCAAQTLVYTVTYPMTSTNWTRVQTLPNLTRRWEHCRQWGLSVPLRFPTRLELRARMPKHRQLHQ